MRKITDGVARWLSLNPPSCGPSSAHGRWGLPVIISTGGLADWLCLGVSELEWLADLKGTASPGHYHYQKVAKQSGAIRLLESPKVRLKAAQRRILREILDLVPGHEAAHGFRAGRFIRSFAAPHVGQGVVLRMDLRDFFPSIGRARVQAVFRTLGYPEPVADILGGLCTNTAPMGGPLYQQPHLPQGAPTSLRPSRTFVFTAPIAGSPASLQRQHCNTRGMPMTSAFPGIAFPMRWFLALARLPRKRVSPSSFARPA